MSENSEIEWTDHTWNGWIGCTKVSPGCANCYAETLMDTRYKRVKWGKGQPRQRTSAANWKLPVKWNLTPWICDNCGGAFSEPCHHFTDKEQTHRCPNISTGFHRARVFCSSLADWLDDEVPAEWLADLLALIHATPNLDWLLLTKRPQNWQSRMVKAMKHNEDAGGPPVLHEWILDWVTSQNIGAPPGNVWLGTTVEDQTRADERIPQLLQIPARVRFLSCEPLLGPVDLTHIPFPEQRSAPRDSHWPTLDYLRGKENPGPYLRDAKIDWVICGGESGAGARPMRPAWARVLRDQCKAAGVSFFFKQWGEHVEWNASGIEAACSFAPSGRWLDGEGYVRVGKKAAGRLLDGRTWDQFPA